MNRYEIAFAKMAKNKKKMLYDRSVISASTSNQSELNPVSILKVRSNSKYMWHYRGGGVTKTLQKNCFTVVLWEEKKFSVAAW